MPTEPATDWTTPLLPLDELLRELPPLDERPFFEAVLREPLLFARVLFARVLEPEAVRLERVRLDAAVERLELEERFDADDPLLLLGLLVLGLLLLLLFERVLDERVVLLSAMESHPFREVCTGGYPLRDRCTHGASAGPSTRPADFSAGPSARAASG